MEDSSRRNVLSARTLLCFCAAFLYVVGCGNPKIEAVEKQALERHHQEVLLRRALRGEIQGPDGQRLFKALRFISLLGREGQLPGPSHGGHARLTSVRGELTPNGPYYFTQEFGIVTSESQNYGYVLTETYSNGEFQLEKAWHADSSGKIVKQYPMSPPPTMLDPRAVFLGPNNPGAERGLNGWYYGALGGGVVARDTNDPATGFTCFKVGITNALSGQTNHADLRSEMFLLGPAAHGRQPMTFSFAYKLPQAINPGDRLQVLFRFYDEETNFLDQNIICLGTNRSDAKMDHYKTVAVSSILAPVKAAVADVVVSANIDDPWTSGAAQFDDFSVIALPPRTGTRWVIVGISLIAVLTALMIWALSKLPAR
jgi:hypothetical protein